MSVIPKNKRPLQLLGRPAESILCLMLHAFLQIISTLYGLVKSFLFGASGAEQKYNQLDSYIFNQSKSSKKETEQIPASEETQEITSFIEHKHVHAQDRQITKKLNSNKLAVYFECSPLFPAFGILRNLTTKDLEQCSLKDGSQITVVANSGDSNGEIKFEVVNGKNSNNLKADASASMENPQQPSPISDISSPGFKIKKIKSERHAVDDFTNLSPASSVKSTKSEKQDAEKIVSVLNGEDITARARIDDEDAKHKAKSNQNKVRHKPKSHECPYCHAKFRLRGYLTRHLKKHSKKKAYKCPFYDPNADPKCHATGGFSRRDTCKTHLKARHFKYPPGVKSGERRGMMGWCSACGEKFLNNEIWVERHIEAGLCPGLPADYVRNLKFGKKKTGKHSKFLDVVADERFFNDDASSIVTISSPASFTSRSASPSTNPSVGQMYTFQAVGNGTNSLSSSSSTSSSLSTSPASSMAMSWVSQKQFQHSKPQFSAGPLPHQLKPKVLPQTTQSPSEMPPLAEDHKMGDQDSNSDMRSPMDESYEEEDYPSLDAECSPYTHISYPAYFYKNVNDSMCQQDGPIQDSRYGSALSSVLREPMESDLYEDYTA